MIYICFGLILTIVGLIFFYKNEKKKKINLSMSIKELKSILNEKTNEVNELNSNIQKLKPELSHLEKEINEKKSFNTSLLKLKEDELERIMEEKKKFLDYSFNEYSLDLKAKIDEEIDDWTRSAQEVANEEKNRLLNDIELYEEELQDIIKDLKVAKDKRESINQAILREKESKEKEDYYRINLSENDWSDIHFLLEIVNHFSNKTAIYKLIWSEYIQKPFKEMMKRVLFSKDPKNVIYMIQNLDTQEIYIGKTSSNISKRWTDHIKSSLNIGTISGANIHKALFNNWDRFSFSILEEVKEGNSLSEREKYYIDIFQSNKVGYNITKGG
jgi:hypothetical protein